MADTRTQEDQPVPADEVEPRRNDTVTDDDERSGKPELLNETVPADEADSLRGWTAQQGPEPPPNAREVPQRFLPEQLPSDEACKETGLRIPEHQLAESEEELDPADRVRLGNTGYSSPLGVVANPEGAHIPGESREPEHIRAAPELAQEPEPDSGGRPSVAPEEGEYDEEAAAEEGEVAEEEQTLDQMTKQELADYAAEQGYEGVSMSMNKDDMIASIEEQGG